MYFCTFVVVSVATNDVITFFCHQSNRHDEMFLPSKFHAKMFFCSEDMVKNVSILGIFVVFWFHSCAPLFFISASEVDQEFLIS